MEQFYQHRDAHWNPKATLVLNQLNRSKERGYSSAACVFQTLLSICDSNGELHASKNALVDYLGLSPSSISRSVKILSDVGLIEYSLSRGGSGTMYRINPEAVCVGRKYYHKYVELADAETGELLRSKKRELSLSENFKRLCERYGGNQLDAKLIAAEIKLLKEWSDTTVNLYRK